MSYIARKFEDSYSADPFKFEHRVFVAGFSLHVISGTLATVAAGLDFIWASPTMPKSGDPAEPFAQDSAAITVYILFYLFMNFISMLAWSTSAGWNFNTGYVWLLVAMGFYDQLRKKRVRVIASGLQSLFGVLALGIAWNATVAGGEQYNSPNYQLLSHWVGALGILLCSFILTVIAFFLALASPTAKYAHTGQVSGWQGAQTNHRVDDNESDAGANVNDTISSRRGLAPKRCGDLGPCAMCDLICSVVLFLVWMILVGFAIDYGRSEPISGCFARLPPGYSSTLTISPVVLAAAPSFNVGPFSIVMQSGLALSATRATRPVFTTPAGNAAFVSIGLGSFSAENQHEAGTFDIVDHVRALSTLQTIDSVVFDGTSFLTLFGTLSFGIPGDAVGYSLNFSVPLGLIQLEFDLKLLNQSSIQVTSDTTRLYWSHASRAQENIFGFGETFSYWNLKGACMPIITREQGIGRGVQPFTYLINRFGHNAAGSWQSTYSAVPHYVTSDMNSMYLDTTSFTVFDMTAANRISIEIFANHVKGRFIAETNPLDIVEEYTKFSGRMRALPSWIGSGAIVGAQGGRARVTQIVNTLIENGVPLVGVWIQDWSGKRVTSFGDRLLWNWKVEERLYPGWWDFVQEMQSKGVKVLTYINPYLADAAPDHYTGVRVPQPMFAEARALNCLVRDVNNNTLIQISATSDFTFGTVDLTNPACVSWYVGIIRSNIMNVSATIGGVPGGAMGWMADFAESLPFNAKLFAGDATEVHNQFPYLWADTCKQAISIVSGGVDFSTDAVYFTRSASPQTPSATTLMWLGDQMQGFNRYDGLATVLPAANSAGLSGFSMVHSDVGGYLGVHQLGGLIALVRSQELLLRWMEISAFVDSAFRSHEGNLIYKSVQVYGTNSTAIQFARFGRIFKALKPYRDALMIDAVAKGYPLARHPFLNFPIDRGLDSIKNQIMLGTELMLCPVLQTGAQSVTCYLPAGSGTWTNFFNPAVSYSNPDPIRGAWFTCDAPVGRPCALVRAGAVFVPAARAQLVVAGFVF